MFDVGFWELCLIGVVALLVLGPEKLPRAARAAGLWMGRARRAISEVRTEIQRELDIEDLQQLGHPPPNYLDLVGQSREKPPHPQSNDMKADTEETLIKTDFTSSPTGKGRTPAPDQGLDGR
jgi:sec-independent protein translocase protein TatB